MHLSELIEQLAVQTSRDDGLIGAPLLHQLREARYASLGKGAGKSQLSSERIQLNLDAHELWEDLSGQIAALFSQGSGMRPVEAPELNLLAWWAVFSAASARGETTLLMHEVAGERVERWVERIHALLTPVDTRPLRDLACPKCGESKMVQGEGVLEQIVDVLAVTTGTELTVTCRACHETWDGDVAAVQLAKQAGLTPDADEVRAARYGHAEENAVEVSGEE